MSAQRHKTNIASVRLSIVWLVLVATLFVSCSKPKSKKEQEPLVNRRAVSSGTFGPATLDESVEVYSPGKALEVNLRQSRLLLDEAMFSLSATAYMSVVSGNLIQQDNLILLSPHIQVQLQDDAQEIIPRERIKRDIVVETIIHETVDPKNVIGLVIYDYESDDELKLAIKPKDLTFSELEDGSIVVSFPARDTNFVFAIAASPKGALPAEHIWYTPPPPNPEIVAVDATGTQDEVSEVHLQWYDAEGSATSYYYAIYSGTSNIPSNCELGQEIAAEDIETGTRAAPTWKIPKSAMLTGITQTGTVTIQLCAVNDRDPVDVSSGVSVTYDLPGRALATLSQLPPANSNDVTIDIVVGGAGVTHYKYAYVEGAGGVCTGATYSEWIEVSTHIIVAPTDGPKLICVLGKTSDKNIQQTPTSYSWTHDLTPPVFTSLSLANYAADGYISLADSLGTADLVEDLQASGYDDVGYILVTSATTCDASLTYGVIPKSNSVVFSAETTYKVCVFLGDIAGNETYDESPLITFDKTSPVFTSVNLINSAADGYINSSEHAASTSLIGGLLGSGYSAATYALVGDAATCGSGLTYGGVPTSNSAAFTSDGLYKVCVRLTDPAGNTTYGSSSSFVFDDTPPAFVSIALAGDAADGYINASERSSTLDLVNNLVASGYDAAGYKLVVSATACNGSLTYDVITKSNSADFTSDGTYKVCVKLTDMAGNTTVFGQSANLILDVTDPEIVDIDSSNSNGYYNQGDVLNITLTASEDILWDGGSGELGLTLETGATDAIATYTSGISSHPIIMTYTVGAGDTSGALDVNASAPQLFYTGTGRVTDLAGNYLNLDVSAATALSSNKTLVVDTEAPGDFAIVGPTGTLHDDTLAVSWGASVGVDTYVATIASNVDCSTVVEQGADLTATTFNPASLDNGTYYICVTAKDLAGNIKSASNNGLSFTVSRGSWAIVSNTNAPSAREHAKGVYDNVSERVYVWGGYDGAYLNSGGYYDLINGTWTAIDEIDGDAPVGRIEHAQHWLGGKMFVWGGYNLVDGILGNGAVFDPVGPDFWLPVNTTDAPSARRNTVSVATDSEVCIWGGNDGVTVLNTGSCYDPALDLWAVMDTNDSDLPLAREGHSLTWTGSELIVWGGFDGSNAMAAGARYDASNVVDPWQPISSVDAPSARYNHSAVWTGSKLIIFGGFDGINYLNDGGVYDPATDTWSALATVDAPSLRYKHVATWIGGVSAMLIWGGNDGTDDLASGALHSLTNGWYLPNLSSIDAPAVLRNPAMVGLPDGLFVWGGYESLYQQSGYIYTMP